MRCAVLGSPIAHSLSPVLHRAGYAALGLDWSYDAVVVEPDGLAGFLDGLGPHWRGLSLTMPLKRVVVPLLDQLTDRAAQAGAANTVVLDRGGRTGHNTDIPGAAAAIRERYDGPLTAATVIGGGATAASVLLALADLGCRRATLVVRSAVRAKETLDAVGRHPSPPAIRLAAVGEPVKPADIVVSTVPADAQTADVLAWADVAEVRFEVLYDPWPTPLAQAATQAGKVLVSGLDLLVHQAALQFTLMTGRDAPMDAMRAAGEGALRGRRR
jgi:shikimate dehydrogenase